MNKGNHIIVAIHVTERVKHASELQEVLSEYGCYIRTRLGLHEASEDYCSPGGIIIIELIDNREKAGELASRLEAIEGISTRTIVFGHE